MNSPLTRPASCLLLLGLLLSACGPSIEAEPAQTPEDALGYLGSALCAGTSVSTLGLDGISTYQGVMAGSGPWAVASPANGIRLEYFVDNVLRAVEDRLGSSGTWYFSLSGVACGSRSFLVKAYPMVVDSAGNRTVCVDSGPRSLSRVVSEACPVVCGDGVCSGNETQATCSRDCCETSRCSDGSCCPLSGRCSNGRACML
jgi:hypothetical protein